MGPPITPATTHHGRFKIIVEAARVRRPRWRALNAPLLAPSALNEAFIAQRQARYPSATHGYADARHAGVALARRSASATSMASAKAVWNSAMPFAPSVKLVEFSGA